MKIGFRRRNGFAGLQKQNLKRKGIYHSMRPKFGIFLYLPLIYESFRKKEKAGARRRTLFTVMVWGVILTVQTIHWIGFFLDDLFFSGYKKIRIKKPVFIVGFPRSGTTFLQRVLAGDKANFTSLCLWELLFAPSITERKILIAADKLDKLLGHPFKRFLSRIEKKTLGRFGNIQSMALDAPWEDYFLLLPVCACFLLVLVFPYSNRLWDLACFDRCVPEAEKKKTMEFYRSGLQRHLYVHGEQKRILSKNPSFTGMIETLKGTFPDCKIIGCVRNPLDAVPSLVSSMQTGGRFFGHDLNNRQFRDKLIDMLVFYSVHLIRNFSRWPEQDRAFVSMETLTENVQKQVIELYRKLDYPLTPSFQMVLEKELARSRNFQSKHDYCLYRFDLKPEDIREKFNLVFEKFGYP